MVIEHQVLDNEASKEYRQHVTEIWKSTYQLVPPDDNLRNIAKRAIRTFKAHFLSILSGIPSSFPNYLWDKILPQTELSLNLLCQSTISPLTSAWEDFNGPFNFDATPLGPIKCCVLIHNNPSTCASWAFRACNGFYVGPALKHYRCFQVVDTATNPSLSLTLLSSAMTTLSNQPPLTKIASSTPFTSSPAPSRKPSPLL